MEWEKRKECFPMIINRVSQVVYINRCKKLFQINNTKWKLLQKCLLSLSGKKYPGSTCDCTAFYMCGEFGINRRRAGHDQRSPPPPPPWMNRQQQLQRVQKIQGERHHAAHTLWLTASPWEVRRRHTTATTTKDGDRSVGNKRSPRLSWLANHSKTLTTSKNNKTLKRPVLFPICTIYGGDRMTVMCVTSSGLLYTLTDEDCLLIWLFVFMWVIRHPRYIYSFVVRGKAAVFGSHAACRVWVFIPVHS